MEGPSFVPKLLTLAVVSTVLSQGRTKASAPCYMPWALRTTEVLMLGHQGGSQEFGQVGTIHPVKGCFHPRPVVPRLLPLSSCSRRVTWPAPLWFGSTHPSFFAISAGCRSWPRHWLNNEQCMGLSGWERLAWEGQGTKPQERKREVRFHNLSGASCYPLERPCWLPLTPHPLPARKVSWGGCFLLDADTVKGKGDLEGLGGIHYKVGSPEKGICGENLHTQKILEAHLN